MSTPLESAAFCTNHADDIKSALRKVLQDKLEAAFDNGDRQTARICYLTLTHTRLLNRAIAFIELVAVPEFLSATSAQAMGADGDFLKWLIEWFSNGGAEKLIEFIKQLIPLIQFIISIF